VGAVDVGRYWTAAFISIWRYWAVLVGGIGRYWSVLVGIWAVLVGIGRYWSVFLGIHLRGGPSDFVQGFGRSGEHF
jgi:hypothetical protein